MLADRRFHHEAGIATSYMAMARKTYGERVLDFAVGEDVGRARQQKLARRLVGVDGPLDREQQIGAGPLDLVEQDRAREAGHESLGVAARRIPRCSVVKAEHVSEVLARRDLSRQVLLPTCLAPIT